MALLFGGFTKRSSTTESRPALLADDSEEEDSVSASSRFAGPYRSQPKILAADSSDNESPKPPSLSKDAVTIPSSESELELSPHPEVSRPKSEKRKRNNFALTQAEATSLDQNEEEDEQFESQNSWIVADEEPVEGVPEEIPSTSSSDEKSDSSEVDPDELEDLCAMNNSFLKKSKSHKPTRPCTTKRKLKGKRLFIMTDSSDDEENVPPSEDGAATPSYSYPDSNDDTYDYNDSFINDDESDGEGSSSDDDSCEDEEEDASSNESDSIQEVIETERINKTEPSDPSKRPKSKPKKVKTFLESLSASNDDSEIDFNRYYSF